MPGWDAGSGWIFYPPASHLGIEIKLVGFV